MYKRYNPAINLEKIYEDFLAKRRELIPYKDLARIEAGEDLLKYNELLYSFPEVNKIHEELNDIGNAYDEELYSVKRVYKELFKTHYISTGDLEDMIDLNYKYQNKNVLPFVSTIYFSRLVRRDVKFYRKRKLYDPLEEVLFKYDVDIDKSVFISYEGLKKWFKAHTLTKNLYEVTDTMVDVLLYTRRTGDEESRMHSNLLGTVKYKSKHNMRYDMQLKRAEREKLYIYGHYDKKPVARIPVDPSIDNLIKKIEELD